MNIGERLGIYEDNITELIAGINHVQESGRESVEILSSKVQKMANDIESLITVQH